MRATLASFSFVLVACSHNPLSPGAGSNPGTGTNTILVTGSARSSSDTPNASADTSFTTDLELDLSINNTPLTTGTVTITSLTGTATLTFQQNGGGQGHWNGTIANYDPVYELNVASGPDNIKGVFLEGPDIHVFTAPTAGASLDVTATTTLKWKRQTTAQNAEFGVEGADGITVPDSGSYDIPPLTLKYEKDQTKANTLHVTRTNSIVPNGAVAGSMFSVSVRNDLDVLAQACATCP